MKINILLITSELMLIFQQNLKLEDYNFNKNLILSQTL